MDKHLCCFEQSVMEFVTIMYDTILEQGTNNDENGSSDSIEHVQFLFMK